MTRQSSTSSEAVPTDRPIIPAQTKRRHTTSSSLFSYIEALQADKPWGSFLDAGTGVNSALWASRLNTTKWTGVTGSPSYAREIEATLGTYLRPQDKLVTGNWCRVDFLRNEIFDTVLADYLLGAIEGFAPYFQSQLFARLRPHVGCKLYVIGLDPYVIGPAPTCGAKIVKAIGRLRDCSLLLADEIPYREYPAEWAIDSLLSNGFKIDKVKRFPNRYSEKWINGQLNMALRRLPKLENTNLAQALTREIENLRSQALKLCHEQGGLCHGADYVIACHVE